jgi:D-alanyl-lipoteichoic acid acyltransferase DltB (MBOAT superfamily)
MLFNSPEFAAFLPIAFILYWFVTNKNLKAQNILLLVASYVFYGWWDWRFLFLLFTLSLVNYFTGIGIQINGTSRKAKIWLIAGLITNIGILGYFKYFNFFIESFINLLSILGYDLPGSTIRIILPLGISFYVFLSISYIIDIYKKNLQADRNVVEVLLALSFFPIILAGPIQRPRSLLPQIASKREFNYELAADGLRQILWGLFAKIVIADSLAPKVEDIFHNYSGYSGSTLALGALFFTVQIYADFSGYSNIAIGIGKLFGFNLMQNFAYPYFARDITEFWKRWHISLTTWFRDYLFVPLSFVFSWRIRGERVLLIKTDHFLYIAASLITWFLTGLWHGANYTFIIWGLINGFFLIIYHLQRGPRKKLLKGLGINNNNSWIVLAETIITIIIVSVLWVIFRADSMKHASSYLNGIFSKSLFGVPEIITNGLQSIIGNLILSVLIVVFFIVEWNGRESHNTMSKIGVNWGRPLRWSLYFGLIITILFSMGNNQQFIYFQF